MSTDTTRPTQYGKDAAPSNVNRTGRSIYRLPVGALSRLAQLACDEGTRGAFHALATDQAIDLRVDWDGDASSFGRFEVLVGTSTWQACELINPSDLESYVIAAPRGDTTFLARFQRGPWHRDCIFGVKAVPIVWKHELPTTLEPSHVAERGTDYEYEAGIPPELVPWIDSVLAGGMHRLTLELSMVCRYEVWVRLQDPKDPNHWQIQNPILDPIDSGGD